MAPKRGLAVVGIALALFCSIGFTTSSMAKEGGDGDDVVMAVETADKEDKVTNLSSLWGSSRTRSNTIGRPSTSNSFDGVQPKTTPRSKSQVKRQAQFAKTQFQAKSMPMAPMGQAQSDKVSMGLGPSPRSNLFEKQTMPSNLQRTMTPHQPGKFSMYLEPPRKMTMGNPFEMAGEDVDMESESGSADHGVATGKAAEDVALIDAEKQTIFPKMQKTMAHRQYPAAEHEIEQTPMDDISGGQATVKIIDQYAVKCFVDTCDGWNDEKMFYENIPEATGLTIGYHGYWNKTKGASQKLIQFLESHKNTPLQKQIEEAHENCTCTIVLDKAISDLREFLHVGNSNEQQKEYIVIQIYLALLMLHKGGVDALGPSMHRDLKPENVFLKQMIKVRNEGQDVEFPRVVLGDFGTSKTSQEYFGQNKANNKFKALDVLLKGMVRKDAGSEGFESPGYNAPEYNSPASNGYMYNDLIDMFSFGKIIENLNIQNNEEIKLLPDSITDHFPKNRFSAEELSKDAAWRAFADQVETFCELVDKEEHWKQQCDFFYDVANGVWHRKWFYVTFFSDQQVSPETEDKVRQIFKEVEDKMKELGYTKGEVWELLGFERKQEIEEDVEQVPQQVDEDEKHKSTSNTKKKVNEKDYDSDDSHDSDESDDSSSPDLDEDDGLKPQVPQIPSDNSSDSDDSDESDDSSSPDSDEDDGLKPQVPQIPSDEDDGPFQDALQCIMQGKERWENGCLSLSPQPESPEY
jgi:serine/threonine protein kinase